MTKHSKILAMFLALSFVVVLAGIAQAQAEETVVCPVSGKEIKKSEAKISYEHKGKTYYFCCETAKEKFVKNPEEYLKKKAEMKEIYTCSMHPKVKSDKPGKCPECGMKLEKKKMMHMEHMDKEHMHKETMHKKGEEKACCPMQCVMSHKDVEMKVENLKDGIAVKITSKNADVAKKLQEMAAKMKGMCCKKEAEKKEVKKEKVKK
jgi:YHS domain-containing protein/DNA-directed RNA polymerase subunit N (RpoN/RPB10)